jgi:hypothetical protein
MNIISWFFRKKVAATSVYQPTPEQLAEMQNAKALADRMAVLAAKQEQYTNYNLAVKAEQERATAAILKVNELNKQLVDAAATTSNLTSGNAALEQALQAMEAQQRALGLL